MKRLLALLLLASAPTAQASDSKNTNLNADLSSYSPTDPTTNHTLVGLQRLEADDLEGAVESFRAQLQFDNEKSSAHNNLGVTLLRMGNSIDAETARKMYYQALQNFESSKALGDVGAQSNIDAIHKNCGIRYSTTCDVAFASVTGGGASTGTADGDGDDNVFDDDEATEVDDDEDWITDEEWSEDPNSYDANNPKLQHSSIGLERLKEKDLDGAIEAFRAQLKHGQREANAHLNLGVALLRKGNSRDKETARIMYYQALTNFQSAKKLEDGDAQDNIDAILKNCHIRYSTNCGQAFAQFTSGTNKGGEDDDDAELAYSLDNPKANHGAVGLQFLQSDNLEDAVASFRSQLKHGQGLSGAHLNLGVTLLRQGNNRDAETARRLYFQALTNFEASLQKGNVDAQSNIDAIHSNCEIRYKSNCAEAFATFTGGAGSFADDDDEDEEDGEEDWFTNEDDEDWEQ